MSHNNWNWKTVFVGLYLYSKTRKANLVSDMYQCGLSVSYKRVLEIENTIAHNLCENFKKGLVCPTNLRKRLFTTFAYDNIDHNPSSSTTQDSFHGTGVSIFQHPDSENTGTLRETVPFSAQTDVSKISLPDQYTTILPAKIAKKDIFIPQNENWSVDDIDPLIKMIQQKPDLLKNIRMKIDMGEIKLDSWAAYNASHLSDLSLIQSISAMLPLFKDDSHSVPLMCHCMKLAKKLTDYLNVGQTPVMVFDQPLYAIAK